MPSFFDKESAARIGERIFLWRHRRELTTKELAERATIGATRLNAIENGDRELRVSEVPRLCAALGITPNDIIGEGFGTKEGDKNVQEIYPHGVDTSSRAADPGGDDLSEGQDEDRKREDH